MPRPKTKAKTADPETYVAFLRGINVGGNNIIPMAALAKSFEKAGYARVKTYIQSGNVLFQSAENDARALEVDIERVLTKAFRYDATVVVRSEGEMAKIVDRLPRTWNKPDPDLRYNVMFLRHEVDSEKVLETLAPKPDIEHVSYGPGVLYWSARAVDIPQTAFGKLGSKALSKQITVRNMNTTKKVLELMSTLE